ncbi:hypothetical protein ACQZV8_12250 [Magnetococcales bacterium HHB-1]
MPQERVRWHRLLTSVLIETLEHLHIEVRPEVPVYKEPPVADVIILRQEGEVWLDEQRCWLADGLRDSTARELLIEFKMRESINEASVRQTVINDQLYLQSHKRKREALQSFLISSQTPAKKTLQQLKFESTGANGVYRSPLPLVRQIRLIVLNELDNKPHNAIWKVFSSRKKEQAKAFATLKKMGLDKISEALEWLIAGLWSLRMDKAITDPNLVGITPDDVMQIGKEWLESARRKGELRGEERGFLKGEAKGEAKGIVKGKAEFLRHLLHEKFDALPPWVSEKLSNATSQQLENWGKQIFTARSLEELFKEQSE